MFGRSCRTYLGIAYLFHFTFLITILYTLYFIHRMSWLSQLCFLIEAAVQFWPNLRLHPYLKYTSIVHLANFSVAKLDKVLSPFHCQYLGFVLRFSLVIIVLIHRDCVNGMMISVVDQEQTKLQHGLTAEN